eukprot:6822838-Prymnesium_polylepis.1
MVVRSVTDVTGLAAGGTTAVCAGAERQGRCRRRFSTAARNKNIKSHAPQARALTPEAPQDTTWRGRGKERRRGKISQVSGCQFRG